MMDDQSTEISLTRVLLEETLAEVDGVFLAD
jgi:hypothetical protein